jgi:hypothetical protein
MRKVFCLIFIGSLLFQAACQRNIFESPTAVAPATLRDVPAVRLNFRFEADVPAAPPAQNENVQNEERNAAVQGDFDQNRPQELLDKTVTSPDKQRVLAVYHKTEDAPAEFRLDMYSADGKILRRVTYDGMAVYFPDTIVWSPDSKTVAFMAKVRTGQSTQPLPTSAPNQNTNQAANSSVNSPANVESNANVNVENTNPSPANPTPVVEQPKAVLTLRTQQIYICGSDGEDVKLLTQNEGLIYFYFVWSPDGSMLAALAATYQEWQILQYQAEARGEFYVPFGRPRLVEKNGRERRLDDYPTNVYPVWSPDSAKVAVAFDKQVRIYDAIGNNPTQAAIPMQNQLLISSKAYKEALDKQEQGGNTNTADSTPPATSASPANAGTTNANQAMTTTIDEDSMVYFNPIIDLKWTEDKMLYFQTGYVKMFKDSANNVRSYLRWHRLIFSPQAVTVN